MPYKLTAALLLVTTFSFMTCSMMQSLRYLTKNTAALKRRGGHLGYNHSKTADHHPPERYATVADLFNSNAKYSCRLFSTMSKVECDIGRTSSKASSNENNKKEYYITNEYQKVYIGIGSNIGDRFGNVMDALSKLKATNVREHWYDESSAKENSVGPAVRDVRTSCLRETPPMYLSNQPYFLNGVIEIETILSPHALLHRLKQIESELGRDFIKKWSTAY